MNKNTLFTLLVLLLTSFISVNASENKAIDIPAAVWQSNKLTAYRLEVLDNLLGERGTTDERIGKSFTIAAWVNLRALPAGGMSYIMGHGAQGHFNQNGSLILMANKDGDFYVKGNKKEYSLTEKVNVGEWIYLTVAYDYDNNSITAYKNGEILGATVELGDSKLEIFADDPCIFYVGGSLYDGFCDEFQFYNKALTQEEAAQAMIDASTVNSITALYNLNEEVDGTTGAFANQIEGDKANINAVYNKISGTTKWQGEGEFPYTTSTPTSPTLVDGRAFAITLEQPATGGSFEIRKDGAAITSGDKFENGTVLSIVATPDAGYQVSSILVNGMAIEGTEFTVSVTTNVTIEFTEAEVEYCTPTFSKGREVGHITSATTTGAVANLNYTDTGTGNYDNYNKIVDRSMAVRTGQTIEVTVQAQNGRWGVERIFVDLNGDGQFGVDEMIIKYGDTSNSNNNLNNVVASFTIPEDFSAKKTLMRVLFTDGDTQGGDNACGTYVDGGFYDFEMRIVDAAYAVTYANATPDLGAINVKAGENAISSGDEIEAGTELTIEVAPNENVKIASFTINDENRLSDLKNNTLKITATNSIDIKVSFKSTQYTFNMVNVTPNSGSVAAKNYDTQAEISDGDKINEGDFITITLTPNKGEKVIGLKNNEEAVDLNNEVDDYGNYMEYSFEAKGDVSIEATFSKLVGITSANADLTAYYDAASQTLNIGDNATAVIYDLAGNAVMNVSEKQKKLAGLNSGCYIVKVEASNITKAFKVIKR
ncbi:LamG-like jellyroll fold domain-containing protein [Bacteroides sp. CG01]|uniref:LamG-like jellyroll fold domain-containing protein n=1 Tax=Bacteroides TaxID=816 RepID=UPI00259CD645|nr:MULTISPECIES: LamG-like jellyroll fold domain-containing protein [Bacteroides]